MCHTNVPDTIDFPVSDLWRDIAFTEGLTPYHSPVYDFCTEPGSRTLHSFRGELGWITVAVPSKGYGLSGVYHGYAPISNEPDPLPKDVCFAQELPPIIHPSPQQKVNKGPQSKAWRLDQQ